MPISSITELAEVSTCMTWLTSASSPLAARNAVSASSTGSNAASRAPKTTSRIPIASGTTVHSACLRSFVIVSLNHLFALASPYCSTVTSGWAARARATASSTGRTRVAAVSGSPFTANWMSTSCPLADTAGARTSCTSPVARTSETTARTAVWSGPAAVAALYTAVGLCTRTSSRAGSFMPALASSQVERPDSPVPYSAWVMVTWPAAPPISIVTMTNASQPPMAASRCRALQPPRVAARLGRPAMTHLPGLTASLVRDDENPLDQPQPPRQRRVQFRVHPYRVSFRPGHMITPGYRTSCHFTVATPPRAVAGR